MLLAGVVSEMSAMHQLSLLQMVIFMSLLV